jgi:hypothetical protein
MDGLEMRKTCFNCKYFLPKSHVNPELFKGVKGNPIGWCAKDKKTLFRPYIDNCPKWELARVKRVQYTLFGRKAYETWDIKKLG